MAIIKHAYSDEPQLIQVPDDAIVTIENDGGYYYALKRDFLSELIEHTRFTLGDDLYEYKLSLDENGDVELNYTLVV